MSRPTFVAGLERDALIHVTSVEMIAGLLLWAAPVCTNHDCMTCGPPQSGPRQPVWLISQTFRLPGCIDFFF